MSTSTKTSGLLGNPMIVAGAATAAYGAALGQSKSRTIENVIMGVAGQFVSSADPIGFADSVNSSGVKTDGILSVGDDPDMNALVVESAYSLLIRAGSNMFRGRPMGDGIVDSLVGPGAVYAVAMVSSAEASV